MGSTKVWWLVGLAVFVVAVSADAAFAWGPATHIDLASQLLSEASLVGAGIMALLAKHARHFLYGNIAADVVFGKRLSKVKHSCHKWSMARGLLEAARTDQQRAFAYGYLAHLAADVVAHNKYVPRQLLLTRTTMNFGHVFWELRAETRARPASWRRLQSTLLCSFPEHEQLLEDHLADTLFSFETNLRIFNRMNLLSSAQRWRGLVDQWARISRWELPAEDVLAYHAEALALMRLAISEVENPDLTALDPSGAATLSQIRRDRKLLRRLSWQGLGSGRLAGSLADKYAPTPVSAVGMHSVA